MATTILELSQLISDSVTELSTLCSVHHLRIPDLNEQYTLESEAFRKDQAVARAANIAAAAAFQLAACLLPPQESILQVTSGHLRSAALRVSIESHVAEILCNAGDQGMHTSEIAKKTGINGQTLGRLLRLLANRHIYREVGPDVFAHNRISSVLSTGKSIEEILKNPTAKHDNTVGFCAFNELLISDAHKASGYLMENMLDPKTSHSSEPQHSPLQRALKFDTNLWDFQSRPENAYRLRLFGIAMKGATAMHLPNLLLELFDWSALPEDALVVDVGGGIGSSARTVLDAYPKLKFVVQDMPQVVDDGAKYWKEVDPEKLQSGRITFQAHNFFGPEPVTNASVFLLKNILHDWSDANCIKILTHLRAAATPETKLLILDCVMTTSGVDMVIDTISNTQGLNPPAVLSTGFRTVNDMAWALDGTMMVKHNTQEHTLLQFNDLLKSAGWELTRVVLSGSAIDSVHAKPI
ncbi:Sterigmatocystin 8-O-methyltransferase [Termitomyces sp. T112]|nr:Sterigmatocystin 8-O-methyltransferase [Termitomyces sp. T112]